MLTEFLTNINLLFFSWLASNENQVQSENCWFPRISAPALYKCQNADSEVFKSASHQYDGSDHKFLNLEQFEDTRLFEVFFHVHVKIFKNIHQFSSSYAGKKNFCASMWRRNMNLKYPRLIDFILFFSHDHPLTEKTSTLLMTIEISLISLVCLVLHHLQVQGQSP